jgi:hypothetical protein
MSNDWIFEDVWNEHLAEADRPLYKRNYIRASEMGGLFIDRYYKMMAEPFTNDYDNRTKRKFEAGRIFEALVLFVAKKAGIFEGTQAETRMKVADFLEVVGHYDMVIGGKPDYEKAKYDVEHDLLLQLLPGMKNVSLALIDKFIQKYPNGLKRMVYDVKSVNSMVFWRQIDSLDKAYPHHHLQLYSYMKHLGMDEGRLLYISKDDLTVKEVQVIADEDIEHRWQADIQQMTFFYNNQIVPPRPEDISFNATKAKYEVNWKLKRSPYLSKITGMSLELYDTLFTKLVNRVNYRVKKLKTDKPDITMTDLRVAIYPYLKHELELIYGTEKGAAKQPILIQSGTDNSV